MKTKHLKAAGAAVSLVIASGPALVSVLWSRVSARTGLAWRGLGSRSRACGLAVLGAGLAWTGVSHAFLTGGDPGCAGGLTASLSATPSFIDRSTSDSVATTLTWSVVLPKNCTMNIGLYLAGQPVVLSGALSREVTTTTTYELKALFLPERPTLASATVTVQGWDPVTVSAGSEITAEDIRKFDAQWMQPFQQQQALNTAYWPLIKRFDAGAWGTGEHMAAMARMHELTYELTDDTRYLNHLQKFIEYALEFRDDHHVGYQEKDPNTGEVIEDFPAVPLDEIRGRRGLPAWGGKSGNSGGLHRVDGVVSSVYAYPIAAFARIVAEDPSLHAAYGDDAVAYANAVLETVRVFLPEINERDAGSFTEAYLASPLGYRTKPTDSDCEEAYRKAVEGEPENESRWNGMRTNCKDQDKGAGYPEAHNKNLAFAMVLIELSRALDSPFYRQAPTRLNDHDVGPIRLYIPFLVSRQQRYFERRLRNLSGPRFSWNFSDDLPSDINSHPEDTSHGALDMRYLELLRRDFDRLNALTAPAEPIALDSSHLQRFANTFLQMIVKGQNFAHNVEGEFDDGKPVNLRNDNCDGWLNLAVADVRVYHECRVMSLRVVNGKQPYLTIGNHSALLMNKHYLPTPTPQPPPDPEEPPPGEEPPYDDLCTRKPWTPGC